MAKGKKTETAALFEAIGPMLAELEAPQATREAVVDRYVTNERARFAARYAHAREQLLRFLVEDPVDFHKSGHARNAAAVFAEMTVSAAEVSTIDDVMKICEGT